MASLIEELIDVLEREYAIYKELIPIAEAKTKVIVMNDLLSLQEITDKEQEAVNQINILEQKRDTVMQNIKTVINKKTANVNLKEMVQLLEKQPKEQHKLASLRDNLKNIVHRLSEINGHNKVLIQQSLDLIEFNMNFIQSTRIVPGNNTYTKSASRYDAQIRQAGMFDAKQ